VTTYTCPEGHQSADPEWCDTCGSPIGSPPPFPSTMPTATVGAAPSPSPTTTGAATGSTLACSHCGAANEPDALFCESCGFDFTTGQAPPVRTPVAPLPATAVQSGPTDFSVTVSVDATWYQLQGVDSNEPCPPASSITLPVHGTTVLIGRTSTERAVIPEVALNDDPGVSRRHAQLVQAPDGAWSAVDLGSMNGSYVIADGAPLTEPLLPIEVGEPVPLPAGGRVYVGAWSCIALIDNRMPPANPTAPVPPDPGATT